MLQSLHIVNFAIIEDTLIEMGPGATIFTGETGAGKSILMDALAILLGRRASVDLVRSGREFFRVEGVFTMDPSLAPVLEDMGIDAEGDEIIISRRMNRNGRGSCSINGNLATVKQLERLGRHLVKLHEQNDSAELLSADFCRWLVDHSAEDVEAAAADYSAAYAEWKKLRDTLEEFKKGKREHERRLDILQWEIEQIEEAGLRSPDEDEEVERRLTVLENHEKIYLEVNRALSLLSDEDGAQERLAEASKRLSGITRYDDALSGIGESLQNALYAAEDALAELEAYAGDMEFSEDELAELQTRDDTLSQLKNKYGPTLAEVIAYKERAQEEYDTLHEMVYDNDAMQKKFADMTAALTKKAAALNALRKTRGAALCEKIAASLRYMEMENARLEVRIAEAEEPTAAGAGEIELYFSANPGEPMRPMRQTASGGEISRISLAIEDILSALFACQTLVFDEIDTGISGSAALRVARKIRHLSESVQVLCITHMPQTASIADAYYSIRKNVSDGRTSTKALLLSDEDHVLDIAWMISGNRPPNESAIQSARDLGESVRRL